MRHDLDQEVFVHRFAGDQRCLRAHVAHAAAGHRAARGGRRTRRLRLASLRNRRFADETDRGSLAGQHSGHHRRRRQRHAGLQPPHLAYPQRQIRGAAEHRRDADGSHVADLHHQPDFDRAAAGPAAPDRAGGHAGRRAHRQTAPIGVPRIDARRNRAAAQRVGQGSPRIETGPSWYPGAEAGRSRRRDRSTDRVAFEGRRGSGHPGCGRPGIARVCRPVRAWPHAGYRQPLRDRAERWGFDGLAAAPLAGTVAAGSILPLGSGFFPRRAAPEGIGRPVAQRSNQAALRPAGTFF